MGGIVNNNQKTGFICFGEVNTPMDRLIIKHNEALNSLCEFKDQIIDAGIVIDDSKYETAKNAIRKLKGFEISCIIICVAGWVPTHAVIRVTDEYRHIPMLVWGLSGWKEKSRIITTAAQAGTTALRPAFQALGYRFKYVYSIIGKPEPIEKIKAFVNASRAEKALRTARIGTMGYRDMLLYGTQFEANSMRKKIGIEVEPFEMLEMVQNLKNLDPSEIDEYVKYIKESWVFEDKCDDSIIETGAKYALSLGEKIKERELSAITLNDVDGMKKLLGYPPAMVFMLLDHFYGIQTTPENDVMGNATQLMMTYVSGENAFYMEYYEFFEDSMLIGVPDYITETATDGDIRVLPAAFGLLSASLLNISKAKPGYVTCARLANIDGEYFMHIYTGEAKQPPEWVEYGWDEPVPQLPSLQVFPDSCSVEEFAQKVSSQHVIVSYGDNYESLCDLCYLLGIKVI